MLWNILDKVSEIAGFRSIIVDYLDVTNVVSAIQEVSLYSSAKVGRCGWAKFPNKWFVHFRMSEKNYLRLVSYLEETGAFYKYSFGGNREEICYKSESLL